ncbi:MAG: acyltransferase family protein [Candidatus Manganitrophus sp.]|nr:acyltransferase family protein [Candidatus Manganitrophus sp.]WDT70432.1 MAG: acyltransferase family protein [Candidatus Manganitrophus sp.]WDT77305.1 MAG: acyltransferase family protein [Candidatus Manganitrophus sp.]WDT82336.1 MAG: acyltransferase family protein [Candidatus Manganitrophus sp.]
MNSRVIHIDIAKGIGILLVVLGHNWIVTQDGAKGELYEMISSFHMPLFFFLSGIFFKQDQKLLPAMLKGMDALLKPYFVTLAMLGIVLIIFEGKSPLRYFIGVAYGTGPMIPWGPLWFLPHLFAIHIFSHLLLNWTQLKERSVWAKSAVLTILLTVGYLLLPVFWQMPLTILGKQIDLPGLPFSVDILLVTGFYFLLGFLLRERLIEFEFNLPLFLLALLFFFLIHLRFDYITDLFFRTYDHLVFSTVSALLGIYIVLSFSKILSRGAGFSALFSYIGVNTLIILIFHDFLQDKIFTTLRALPGPEILYGIVAFLLGVALPLAIAEIIRSNTLLQRCYLPIKSSKQVEQTQ